MYICVVPKFFKPCMWMDRFVSKGCRALLCSEEWHSRRKARGTIWMSHGVYVFFRTTFIKCYVLAAKSNGDIVQRSLDYELMKTHNFISSFAPSNLLSVPDTQFCGASRSCDNFLSRKH